MSSLPPRPPSPSGGSSRGSPRRANRRQPSSLYSQHRPPSPRPMHRSRSRERSSGSYPYYRSRTPPPLDSRLYGSYERDRDRERGRDWTRDRDRDRDRYDTYSHPDSKHERHRRDEDVDRSRYDDYRRDDSRRYHEYPSERSTDARYARQLSPSFSERLPPPVSRPMSPPRRFRSPPRSSWRESPPRRQRSRSPPPPSSYREHAPYSRTPPRPASSRYPRSPTPPTTFHPNRREHLHSSTDRRLPTDSFEETTRAPSVGTSSKEFSRTVPVPQTASASPSHTRSSRSRTPALKQRRTSASPDPKPYIPKRELDVSPSKWNSTWDPPWAVDPGPNSPRPVGYVSERSAQECALDGPHNENWKRSLLDILPAKPTESLTAPLDNDIAKAILLRQEAAAERAKVAIEVRRCRNELTLTTLDLVFMEDRTKIAERQRINFEKGLPLDAFDLLVRDGMIDDMGILAAGENSHEGISSLNVPTNGR